MPDVEVEVAEAGTLFEFKFSILDLDLVPVPCTTIQIPSTRSTVHSRMIYSGVLCTLWLLPTFYDFQKEKEL